MDTTRRTVAKALSWQLMGLVSMTALGTIFTGSAGIGGVLALTSAALGTVCYIVHEKLWALFPGAFSSRELPGAALSGAGLRKRRAAPITSREVDVGQARIRESPGR